MMSCSIHTINNIIVSKLKFDRYYSSVALLTIVIEKTFIGYIKIVQISIEYLSEIVITIKISLLDPIFNCIYILIILSIHFP